MTSQLRLVLAGGIWLRTQAEFLPLFCSLGDVHEDGEEDDDVDLDLLYDKYNNYENSISRAVCGITSTP